MTYKITTLPVVLLACHIRFTWLREEHKLRVLQKRVLRKVFEERGTNKGLKRIP